jgi:TolB-like protein
MMPNKFLLILIFIFFNVSFSWAGGIQEKTVSSIGYGATENEAVQDALIEALGQIKGKQIDAEKLSETKRLIKDNQEDLTKSSNKKISEATSGVISSYKILKMKKTDDGLFKVKIKATISVYEKSKQLDRRRLAVLPFRINNNIFNEESISFINSWQKDLEEGLTQTRRFAMIDKSYEYDSNKELSSYQNKQYDINEVARLGNKAGVDYMVIGTLENLANKNVSVGGKDVKLREVSIALRIIDIASGQIKFAKTVAQPKKTVRDILFAIYPIAVVAVNKNNVTLNSGGDFLKKGSMYKVVKLGKELIDPYTKEKLGREEIDIGEIKLTEINAKTSKAKIIKGNEDIAKGFSDGLIIRPLTNKQKKNLVDELDNMDY